MSMRYMEIACSNKPSSNKVSNHRGISEMIFQIPEMDSFVDPKTIRICGSIQCYKDDAHGDLKLSKMTMDARLGVYSCFNMVTTRSLRHQTTIEQSRNFNRFMSSFLPLSSSLGDLQSHLNNTALCTPSVNQTETSLTQFAAETHFALPLPTGLLNGGNIPLSSQWGIGGLEISIFLENDSQVFFATDGTADEPGAWYEITNPHLVCEVMTPAPDILSQLVKRASGQLTFQSVSSYYDTISSTNAQINFNLGLSKVRSAFVTFIDSTQLNNINHNGLATLMPTRDNAEGSIANVTEYQFLKAGTQFPKLFPETLNVRDVPKTSVCDPATIRDYIDAVVPYNKNTMASITQANSNRNWQLTPGANSLIEKSPFLLADGGLCWGIGATYDNLGGQGTAFNSENWGLNMVMDGSDGNVTSCFIFVNSEQTLVFNPNGVQVIK